MHSDFQSMGPDRSDIFVFGEVSKELLKQIVIDWKLTISDEPSSAYDRSETSWWPSHESRTSLPSKYEHFDKAKKVFLSVWYDSEKELMYIETADW